MLSRRTLLLGAGGTVITAGGVAAWFASRPTGTSTTTAPTTAPATAPATAPTAVGGNVTSTAPVVPGPTSPAPAVPVVPVSDRVLVVVQMGGGNDALNTLVPVTGSYHDARPTIGLADDALLALPGDVGYGLHPALAPLTPSLDTGRVGVVAGIGFEHPDRSHFAALDMWWSAAPGDTFRTGWLGRWLDATAAAPGGELDVLRAVGLGGAVPALRADLTQAIGVNQIERFVLPTDDDAVITAWASLDAAHTSAREAAEAFAGLSPRGTAAGSASTPAGASLGSGDTVIDRLRAAAELIIAEAGVRVVHVSMNGFDTHAGQLDRHELLLGELASGIAAFQHRLAEAGQSHRVLLVTTSEFGRRVTENGSSGTDHGKAGVQFVVGDAVSTAGTGVVFGTLDPGDLVEGDLRPVVDPRSLYATALDWVGADAAGAIADGVLGAAYERLPFVVH